MTGHGFSTIILERTCSHPTPQWVSSRSLPSARGAHSGQRGVGPGCRDREGCRSDLSAAARRAPAHSVVRRLTAAKENTRGGAGRPPPRHRRRGGGSDGEAPAPRRPGAPATSVYRAALRQTAQTPPVEITQLGRPVLGPIQSETGACVGHKISYRLFPVRVRLPGYAWNRV